MWQRLGYLLENIVGEKDLADELYNQMQSAAIHIQYAPLSTSASNKYKERDNRWKLNINIDIETDDL